MANAVLNEVVIPSILLLVGTAIIKLEWLPVAVVLIALIGAYKIFFSTGGTYFRFEIAYCELL